MSRMGVYTLLKHYRLGKCERIYSTDVIYKGITFRHRYGDYCMAYRQWEVRFNKHDITIVYKPGYNFRILSDFAIGDLKGQIIIHLRSFDIAEIDRLFRLI